MGFVGAAKAQGGQEKGSTSQFTIILKIMMMMLLLGISCEFFPQKGLTSTSQ